MSFWTFDNQQGGKKGDDGETVYSYNKGTYLYIGSQTTNEVVVFKSFLDSFQLSFVPELTDESYGEATIVPQTKSARFKYTVSVNVPSRNDVEAGANHRKYYKLERLIRRSYTDKSTGKLTRKNKIRVLLANLIYNGLHNSNPSKLGGSSRTAWRKLKERGVQGSILQVSREVDHEMGFWDGTGFMYPKAFKIKFELLLSQGFEHPEFGTTMCYNPPLINDSDFGKLPMVMSRKKVPYMGKRSHRRLDTGNWPFGYNKGRIDKWQDPSAIRYQQVHKNSEFTLLFTWDGSLVRKINFPVYLESYTDSFATVADSKFESSMGWNKIIKRSDFRKRKVSFSVPVFRDLDGKVMCEKIGQLYRFMLPMEGTSGKTKTKKTVFVRFADFVGGSGKKLNKLSKGSSLSSYKAESAIVRSVSVELDLEMGFWEQANNFLIPKGYKLSFELDLIDDI